MAQDITVTLTANTKQFDKAIKNSKREVDSFEKSGVAGFGKVAGAVAGLIGAAKGLQGIVTVGAKFQDLQDSLNAVFGSARQGEAAFKRIKDFSTRTQFGVDTLTNAFIQLKGAGVEPTEELLMTFADTASVTTDQMGTFQAALDLVSRSTAGGLGLEDLNRLADRGIPVFQILKEQLGLTRLEVSEFGKTTEGANQIIAALTDGLNTRFGGTLQTKLDNVSVKFSNMKIAIENLAAAIFEKFEPAIAELIDDITAAATEAEKFVSEIKTLADAADLLKTSLDPVLEFFRDFSALIAALALPFLIRGVVLLGGYFLTLANSLATTIVQLKNTILGFLTLRKTAFMSVILIILKVSELISGLNEVDATLREKLVVGAKIFANGMIGALAGVANVLKQAVIGPFRELSDFIADPLNYKFPSFADIGESVGQSFKEGFEKGSQVFDIPEEFKKVAEEFMDFDLEGLDIDFGFADETNPIPGITDLGFILENQREKIENAVAAREEAMKKLATTMGDVGKEIEKGFIESLGNAQKALSEDLATALVEGQSVMDSFKNFFKKVIKDIIAQALRLMIIQPILSSIFGAFGAPITFSPAGQISFKPKARGGPVSAGGTYLVGEKGPEILQMGSMGGSIIPNGGFGGTSVTYNINAVDSQSFEMALAKDPSFVFAVTEAGRRKQPGRI